MIIFFAIDTIITKHTTTGKCSGGDSLLLGQGATSRGSGN